jgi:eukaryotic-like serine/threonine-protein kinase
MTDSTSAASQNPDEQEPDLSNSRLGEFLLLRRLGTGGMADVYLAEQTSLNRLVAVKILKSGSLSASNAVLLKRFEQEARAAGGLNHPNIVQIFMTGREGKLSYIVQEYVAGLNLSQWIRKHGSPDFLTGLRWMQQIASALRTASEAGIVHRDVKPENIMITRGGIAKVTDFGLAQLGAATDQKMNLTQAGTTMGTPWYMSPEQIQGDKLDHRSDQYSFGVTCFHMFAGRPPFPGKNAMSVAVQHLKEDPPELSSFRADLPKPICTVIHRMMAKQARDRFPREEDLELALRKLEQIPVNHAFDKKPGWFNAFARWIPALRFLSVSMLLVLTGGFLWAQKYHPPLHLPAPAEQAAIRKESSAARQFAVAMLNPHNRDAWKMVITEFPLTTEAEMAQARLGLSYVLSPIPNFTSAMDEFEKMVRAGDVQDKKYLKVIGRIGQAWVLSQQAAEERTKQTPEAEVVKLLDLGDAMLSAAYDVFTGPNKDVELEFAIAQAPQELRDFMRSSNRSLTGPAGAFGP